MHLARRVAPCFLALPIARHSGFPSQHMATGEKYRLHQRSCYSLYVRPISIHPATLWTGFLTVGSPYYPRLPDPFERISGFLRCSSPITAAGPFPTLTGFPFPKYVCTNIEKANDCQSSFFYHHFYGLSVDTLTLFLIFFGFSYPGKWT